VAGTRTFEFVELSPRRTRVLGAQVRLILATGWSPTYASFTSDIPVSAGLLHARGVLVTVRAAERRTVPSLAPIEPLSVTFLTTDRTVAVANVFPGAIETAAGTSTPVKPRSFTETDWPAAQLIATRALSEAPPGIDDCARVMAASLGRQAIGCAD